MEEGDAEVRSRWILSGGERAKVTLCVVAEEEEEVFEDDDGSVRLRLFGGAGWWVLLLWRKGWFCWLSAMCWSC